MCVQSNGQIFGYLLGLRQLCRHNFEHSKSIKHYASIIGRFYRILIKCAMRVPKYEHGAHYYCLLHQNTLNCNCF